MFNHADAIVLYTHTISYYFLLYYVIMHSILITFQHANQFLVYFRFSLSLERTSSHQHRSSPGCNACNSFAWSGKGGLIYAPFSSALYLEAPAGEIQGEVTGK